MAHSDDRLALPRQAEPFFGLALPVLAIVFVARLIMDSGTRIMYPFIPQVSAGLGLSVVGFSWLLSIRSIVGLVVPVFGLLSDRYGQRAVMALGLLCEAIGVIGVALAWQWWAVVPVIIFGLSLAAFLPAQQAYVSNQVSYNKRGRALAAVEFSWAVVAILVLPVVGWMITVYGWRAPFLLLGGLSFLGMLFVWWRLPPTHRPTNPDLVLLQARAMWRRSEVLATVGVAFLLFIAVSGLLSVWGVWLSADFGLDARAIGAVAISFGFAELSGSGVSSMFIDRIGKRRGSSLGLLLTAAAFLLLPLTRHSLVVAVPALVISFMLLEFTIVSLVPLYSEQLPEARGTLLSLAFLGSGLGSAAGPPLATSAWEQYGLWLVCLIVSSSLLLALAVVHKFLHDPHEASAGVAASTAWD